MTPIAPLADPEALVRAMGKSHRRLVENLLERAADPRVEPSLRDAHRADQKNGRTGEAYETYRDGFCDQVAASWVLCAVFARTLEDRGYVPHRIAGPGASDKLLQFRAQFKFLGERDYLLQIFDAIALLPGGKEVFGPGYAPLWRLGPTSRAVGEMLAELRAMDGAGLRFSFGRPEGEEHDGASTRYLGDLYQDLNEGVRKRYALLQTPEFVERFLLDNTLDPAIRERGIAVTVLDPACGSGHLLLGAYDRLFDARRRLEPGLPVQQSARKALGQVYGVDLNPYAAAVARFRLLLSYLNKAKIPRLDAIPEPLGIHIYVGDSLLAGLSELQATFGDVLTKRGEAPAGPGFERGALLSFFEREADELLGATRFDVVVANPPYITEKDPAKRDLIRTRYKAAAGKYALSAPFVERIFQLGNEGAFTGQITSNSFMKREFGKPLIEEVLPSLDLTEVIDTAGAYIPGHGTPTVILFGRARKPRLPQVRVVMGNHAEPATPENPADGKVWSSIVAHRGEVGCLDEYVSVADVPREKLAQHPWSLGGGGVAELKDLIEQRTEKRLGDFVTDIGFDAIMGEDDLFVGPRYWAEGIAGTESCRILVAGDSVRDWSISVGDVALFPYDSRLEPSLPLTAKAHFWTYHKNLVERRQFGKNTLEAGLAWFEYRSFYKSKRRTSLSITFAFVATHNHFVLDRGGRVFKQTAPIIKMPEAATEADHLALIGYLNSSTACFWMKQACFPKSNAGQHHHPDPSKFSYEFSGTRLGGLPVPPSDILKQLGSLARAIDDLGTRRMSAMACLADIWNEMPTGELCDLVKARWRRWDDLREEMIVLQEELDWAVYVALDLAPPTVLARGESLIGAQCARGDRPFERIHPREGVVRVRGEGRNLGQSELASETVLPPALAKTWAIRERAIRESADLTMIETSQYKRHWRDTDANVAEPDFRAKQDLDWLETYLLDRAEAALHEPRPLSIRALAQALDADPKVRAVAEVLTSSATYDLESLLGDLLLKESIASAKCQRYTDAGLENHALWERTWDLQRLEDAGQKVEIPLPPRYDQKDFENSAVAWRLRGKLDVPKERFISYPTATAPSGAVGKAGLFFGWAGWTHLQQLQATIQLWQEEVGLHDYELIRLGKRKDLELSLGAAAATDEALRLDTAARTKLLPLLQTMVDLLPWVRQWHNEDGDADAFEAYVTEQARRLEVSLDEARAYRRPARAAARAGAGAGRKAVSLASSEQLTLDASRARPAAALDDSALAAAVEAVRSLDQGPGVALAELAERLGLSSAALRKTLDTLVEAGRLVERKKRPRLVSCKADDAEAREGAGS